MYYKLLEIELLGLRKCVFVILTVSDCSPLIFQAYIPTRAYERGLDLYFHTKCYMEAYSTTQIALEPFSIPLLSLSFLSDKILEEYFGILKL